MRSTNKYLKILKLSPSRDFTLHDIKNARNKLLLKIHPDKNPNDPEATIETQRINEAYEMLAKTLTNRQKNNIVMPTPYEFASKCEILEPLLHNERKRMHQIDMYQDMLITGIDSCGTDAHFNVDVYI